MVNNTVKLSVVIPSYNESKNIERGILDQVYAFLTKQSYSWEIIFTDDGSSDDTVKLLQKFAENKPKVKILLNPHAGKGPTVCAGMLAATGKFRLFTDFDQSTPIEEVNNALALIDQDFDVVIGSREGVGAIRKDEPMHRHVMGRVFNLLVQIMALRGIQDSQCGFKMFTQEAVMQLFNALYVYKTSQVRKDAFTGAFDVEILFLARKWGLKIKEMPVVWEHVESDRVNPLKDSFRMFRDIVKIRIAWLTGKYVLNTTN